MFDDVDITGAVFACVLVVLILIAIAGGVESCKAKNEIKAMGYNVTDVDIFLRGRPWTRRDFVNSEGVRKQFNRFKDGDADSAPEAQGDTEFTSGMAGSGKR
jgi:hypothetical protein